MVLYYYIIMTIYFLRHAKTDSNIHNRWQGRSDLDLSNEGINQLKQLAKLNYSFDVIFSSPTKRTLKTANVFKNFNNLIICDERILERNFGNLESKEVQEGEKEILSNWILNTDLNQNVEKIQDMYYQRIKPFLLELKSKYNNSNKKILIVSHSWVGRLISFFCSKETKSELIAKAPINAQIYEYDI